MAALSQPERQQWLASVADRFRRSPDPSLAQELREVARGCRSSLADTLEAQLGPFDVLHLRALLEVPRERFVRPEDMGQSAEDKPLALDDRGLATISAPHAYLLSYRLLELRPGDSLVELGTGSGYGAALAAFIVGPRARVLSFEIDRYLAERARANLTEVPQVTVIQGDATTSAAGWSGANKVVVTFAVDELPTEWLDALPKEGKLVAPVGANEGDQRLVLARRKGATVLESEHGAVRYVKNRSAR